MFAVPLVPDHDVALLLECVEVAPYLPVGYFHEVAEILVLSEAAVSHDMEAQDIAVEIAGG